MNIINANTPIIENFSVFYFIEDFYFDSISFASGLI